MELRGRKRRRTGMSFYMALGLCAAAVCLIALSTMINRQQRNTKNDAELTEWASTEWASTEWVSADLGADDAAEQTGGDSYPGDVYVPAAEAEDKNGVLSDGEDHEDDITPYRQLPDDAEDGIPRQEDEREKQVVEAEAGSDDTASGDQAVMASARIIMPVPGQIVRPFSGTELVFCPTFGDWRVHEGMDIAADAGGEVHCAASGAVMDFVEDPLYGYSVVVEQDDDAIMYYCGLSSTCMVSPGMRVTAGDVIGYVGEVPCELSDGAHIHLALMKDGQFEDPGKYMP